MSGVIGIPRFSEVLAQGDDVRVRHTFKNYASQRLWFIYLSYKPPLLWIIRLFGHPWLDRIHRIHKRSMVEATNLVGLVIHHQLMDVN